jgi:hypothetical protein
MVYRTKRIAVIRPFDAGDGFIRQGFQSFDDEGRLGFADIRPTLNTGSQSSSEIHALAAGSCMAISFSFCWLSISRA